MTRCEYVSVDNCDKPQEESDEDESRSWEPLLRQLLISSCVWSQFFQFGLCLGAPTVIIPRMRNEQGEHYVSRNMASWMSSALNYAAVPWPPLLAILSSYLGRRYTFAIVVITSLVGFAALSVSNTPQHVLAAMVIQGPLAAVSLTISLYILTEYSTPLYRGVFLTVKSATLGWAIWIANAIGTFTHWHYIAWLGLACAMYNVGILFLWPESPYWLASKGKLEQCREAHRWLRGHSQSSEKELREIIKGHQEYHIEDSECNQNRQKKTFGENWRRTWIDMKCKSFYKSFLMNLVLIGLYQCMGKLVVSIYAIDIIRDITKSEYEAYKGMLILDGVTVMGMYIGCGLSKKLRRRTLLISAGGAGSVFLLMMSVYLFLVRFEVISENKYITVSLLTGYSLSVSAGPFIITSTVKGELLPLRLRGTAVTLMAMTTYLTQGTNLKIAPYIFKKLGMDGAFLLYGLMTGVFLMIIYVYLPETKDKTLKEIQDMITGNYDSEKLMAVKDNTFEVTKHVEVKLEDISVKPSIDFVVNNR